MSVPTLERTPRKRIARATAVRAAIAALGLAAAAAAFAYDFHVGAVRGLSNLQLLLVVGGLVAWEWIFLPIGRGPKILLFSSVAATLLVAEAALRILLPTYYNTLYRVDDRCIFRYIPGARKTFMRYGADGGQRILVQINRDGFRGGPLLPRGAAKRVAVFGDSFIAAEGSELDKTFVKRLEAKLGAALGRPVECVNAGVPGYGPDQELVRMEQDVPRLAPDLVILGIFADNDLGDFCRNKLFRLDDSGSLVPNRFLLLPSLRGRLERPLRLFAVGQKAWWRIEDAVTARGNKSPAPRGPHEDMENSLRLGREDYRNYVIQGDNVVSDLFQDHYDADVSLTPDSDSARYRIRMMDAVISRMQEIVARQGVPLLLVIIPSGIDLRADFHHLAPDTVAYPDYRRSGLTDLFEGIAERHAIPSVNLYAPFSAVLADSLYFEQDIHWNDAGQELAATKTAEFIVSRGLLK